MSERKRVAVLISGRGSNMLALAHAAKDPDYPGEIVGVFSDKADADGLRAAHDLGIPARAVIRQDFGSKAEHEAALMAAIDATGADVVCLAGYMRLLSPTFVDRYAGCMINIHPSLLPRFPGLDTHRRAIEAGADRHGCTVHFVTAEMDAGPIIAQAEVAIAPDDTPETLAAQVLAEEHRLYPDALAKVLRGDARIDSASAAR